MAEAPRGKPRTRSRAPSGAVRAARAPRGPAGTGGSTVEDGPDPADDGGRPRPICQISLCPICTAVIAVGEAQPELMEHLLAAGREVLLAVRSLIDARLEEERTKPGLHRVTIR